MKFNQLVDYAAEKFEAAQVFFGDLARQAQLQAQCSQLQSQYRNYLNAFLTAKSSQIIAALGETLLTAMI